MQRRDDGHAQLSQERGARVHGEDEALAIAELRSVVNVAMPHWRGVWFPSTAILRIASFVGAGAGGAWMRFSDRARDTGNAACERHARNSGKRARSMRSREASRKRKARALGAHASRPIAVSRAVRAESDRRSRGSRATWATNPRRPSSAKRIKRTRRGRTRRVNRPSVKQVLRRTWARRRKSRSCTRRVRTTRTFEA